MKNIRKLWENDLKTRGQVERKYNEILEEYTNYIKLGVQENWIQNKVYIDTCKRFNYDLVIMKSWLNEF